MRKYGTGDASVEPEDQNAETAQEIIDARQRTTAEQEEDRKEYQEEHGFSGDGVIAATEE
jgi:murein L,D-transpeptidase YcbB/YkuD